MGNTGEGFPELTRSGGEVSARVPPGILEDMSLEMTGKDVPGLHASRHVIPAGTRINVTFLGHEHLEMRVDAARAVREMGFVPVPHISARRLHSPAQLAEFLTRLQDVDAVENVFLVGGDPSSPEGPYEDSMSVIRSGMLSEHGVREVGFAGYPDGHPSIPREILWAALDAKSTLLAEQGIDRAVITQLAFDAGSVAAWIGAARDRGFDAKIRVGVPGPTRTRQLIGFARRLGIATNASIVKKYGLSLTNLVGSAGPDRFVDELTGLVSPSMGDTGLHLYTFGGLLAASEWARDVTVAHGPGGRPSSPRGRC